MSLFGPLPVDKENLPHDNIAPRGIFVDRVTPEGFSRSVLLNEAVYVQFHIDSNHEMLILLESKIGDGNSLRFFTWYQPGIPPELNMDGSLGFMRTKDLILDSIIENNAGAVVHTAPDSLTPFNVTVSNVARNKIVLEIFRALLRLEIPVIFNVRLTVRDGVPVNECELTKNMPGFFNIARRWDE